MKLKSMLKSRTCWCGIVAAVIAGAQLIFGDSEFLTETLANKEQLASNLVLIAQGALGVGAILFRVKAKDRD